MWIPAFIKVSGAKYESVPGFFDVFSIGEFAWLLPISQNLTSIS